MPAKSDSVRALVRGLEILRYLNAHGASQIAAIAAALDIPRPSVYRLVDTMEEAGYISRSATDSRVRITALAVSLGGDAAARSELAYHSGPVLTRLTDQHSWPIDLTVYEDGHMIVQETTHGRSPLSVDRNMAGFALPMLRSSAGRIYLAKCNQKDRRFILDQIRAEGSLEDQPYLSRNWLEENLSAFERQGFATRDPKTFRPKTSSIAVPIMSEERVLGCLSIIWVSKAETMEQAIERYVGPLTEAAETVAKALAP